MPDATPAPGVLYTEYAGHAAPPFTTLWSFESHVCRNGRESLTLTRDGHREFWLDPSDPLLNVLLPDTGLGLIVNFGDPWAAGRSLAGSAFLPRVCVLGPVTQARLLRIGRTVRAVGAILDPIVGADVFGAPVSHLVDRALPLEQFWHQSEVEALTGPLPSPDLEACVVVLRAAVAHRAGRRHPATAVERDIAHRIRTGRGRIAIDPIARAHGLTRQQLARRFRDAAGLPPKLFARITRFQALVQALLSSDVSRWADVSTSVGFYDQAHMINEFHSFAGAPPTVFFQSRGDAPALAKTALRGRPSEWCRALG